jgi:hypothetical protein
MLSSMCVCVCVCVCVCISNGPARADAKRAESATRHLLEITSFRTQLLKLFADGAAEVRRTWDKRERGRDERKVLFIGTNKHFSHLYT